MYKINDKLTVISQFRGMFTDKLFANIHNLFTVSAVIFSPFAQLVPHLYKQTRLFYLVYDSHLWFGTKVEFSVFVLNKNGNDSVYCVMCADRHVFCTMTQLWLKLKLWSLKTNMLPGLLCMELGRNRFSCTINGTLAPPNTKLQTPTNLFAIYSWN